MKTVILKDAQDQMEKRNASERNKKISNEWLSPKKSLEEIKRLNDWFKNKENEQQTKNVFCKK